MRILHVTPYFKPSWEAGGPPRMVYDLASWQVAEGHDVTVYTTDGFKRRLDTEKNRPVDVDGIRTYYFRNLSMYLTGNLNMPIPCRLPSVAAREIGGFDIIHIHEHRTFLAAVTSILASRHRVPYIVQPHGSVPTMTRSFIKNIFDFMAGRRIMAGAERVVASSEIESRFYRKVYPFLKDDSIIRVPNPVKLEGVPQGGAFRWMWGLGDERIVLYIGRIHEMKGLDLLVRAYREMDEVKLVIAGPDDHYLEGLRALMDKLGVSGRVIMTGPLYGMDKLGAYRDADVFVLPSRYESFGNVVAEAISCGTPVVVTSKCGVSEWIEPSDGVIVEPSVEGLRKGIYRVLNNRESFRPSAEKFDPDIISRRFQEVYVEVLSSR